MGFCASLGTYNIDKTSGLTGSCSEPQSDFALANTVETTCLHDAQVSSPFRREDISG